ncbi:MAG: hypothetical protein ACP5O5_05980 [Fervidicoccaceae archaeon]
MPSIKEKLDAYMRKFPWIREYCERVLRTERWGGSVVMMVVDASFTSIGLDYFNSVLPKAIEFKEKFVDSGKIKSLKDLSLADIEELRTVWKNRRSWVLAKEISSRLSSTGRSDREALRSWAKEASLKDWRDDPIGRIKGMGIVTFQYLRTMGGVDTVVPDKIVKRILGEIFVSSGIEVADDDIEFVEQVEKIAVSNGYRPAELTWMTWFVQQERRRDPSIYLDLITMI